MYRIICPNCLKELSATDIAFESIVPAAAKPDEIKYRYLKRYNQALKPEDLSAMSRTIVKYSPKDAAFDADPESGTPLAWREPLDGNTYTSRVRVCNFCHMPLPVKAGLQEMVSIGFAGNSNAGKTVYLLSLIHDLSLKLGGFSLTPDPAFFSTAGNRYKQLYQEMYEPRLIPPEEEAFSLLDPAGAAFSPASEYQDASPYAPARPSSGGGPKYAPYYLPGATQITDRLMPIVLNCNCNGKSFLLVMFDMAGEGVRSEMYLEVNGEYLRHADGVVYLKDPEYLPILGAKGNVLVEHEYLARIIEGINPSAYIAITMTKFDLLERRRNPVYDRIIGANFVGNGVNPHQYGFKDADMRVMNSRLMKLYSEPDYSDAVILNTYKHSAKAPVKRGFFQRKKAASGVEDRVMLFAASALGCHAQVLQDRDAKRNYATACPSGVRNVDPIAWILNKYGLFPSAQGDRSEEARL